MAELILTLDSDNEVPLEDSGSSGSESEAAAEVGEARMGARDVKARRLAAPAPAPRRKRRAADADFASSFVFEGDDDFSWAPAEEAQEPKAALRKSLLARKLEDFSAGKQAGEDDDDDDDEEDDRVEEEERLQAAVAEQQAAVGAGADDDDEREREKQARLDNFFAETVKAEDAGGREAMFPDFSLSRPLLRAVEAIGFVKPTPIQAAALPPALAGRDVWANAVTGSGKTAAFLLPLLERLVYRPRAERATRVLIVTPTRELATQCHTMLRQLAQFTDIEAACVVGGQPLRAQEAALRARPDVVVCTPGRMIDHVRNTASVHLDDVEILVLDEADRLLDEGFTDEVFELVRGCPRGRQTLLFSATMTDELEQLVALSLTRPVRVAADQSGDLNVRLVQEFVRIREAREPDREAIVLALCKRTFRQRTIVFFSSKRHAHRMMVVFGLAGLRAAELHGNLNQNQRLASLQQFREGSVDLLLCTDLAARGLDIPGVEAVINFDMPTNLDTYVHRVGRTARAGCGGRAVTLIRESRRPLMKQIVRSAKGLVKSRAVPGNVIAKWSARIEAMEPDVERMLKEEALERRVASTEREAERVQNIVEHHDEIMARPQRTWFQTAAEKDAARGRARDVQAEEEAGLSAKARRAQEARNKALAARAEAEKRPHRLTRQKRRRAALLASFDAATGEDGSAAPNADQIAAQQKAVARKAKRMFHEEQRMPRAAAGRAKGRDPFAEDMGDASGAASGEKRARVGDRFVKAPKVPEFKDRSEAIPLRKGGKQGRAAFKSKARFKRRKRR